MGNDPHIVCNVPGTTVCHTRSSYFRSLICDGVKHSNTSYDMYVLLGYSSGQTATVEIVHSRRRTDIILVNLRRGTSIDERSEGRRKTCTAVQSKVRRTWRGWKNNKNEIFRCTLFTSCLVLYGALNQAFLSARCLRQTQPTWPSGRPSLSTSPM